MSIRTKTKRFHENHGKNIKLNCDRTKAIRKSDTEQKYINNIVFTQLPVMMLQPLVFKITQTNANSFFSVMIGFTCNDPHIIQGNIKDYSEYGNWNRMLVRTNENRRVLTISFHVEQSGCAFYFIDDEKGYLIGGLDVSKKLWAFIHLSISVREIEWVGMAPCLDPEKSLLKTDESRKTSFHWIHGQDICLKKNKTTAYKSHDPGYYAYTFNNRPFVFSEKIVFTVNKLQASSEGIIEYGITSNDPSTIFPNDLPENTGDLLNFSNYWVICKDQNEYNIGDVITFIITKEGKFIVVKNFTSRTCFLQMIDVTQPLWLFIKLCGSVSEISIRKWSNREYCDIMTKKNQFLDSLGSECLLCCEKPCDCALLSCGHMCMCYECAQSAWQCKDIVHCPVCRADIQDVFKIYS